MVRILIVYDSKTGNTEKMAYAVAEGAKEAGAMVRILKAADARVEDLIEADAIILGSPTYFGSMSYRLKKLIDESSQIRGKLKDKVGAVFTSSDAIDGGNEMTLFSMISAMLIHGMIIVGDPLETGGHFGVVSIREPTGDKLNACKALGKRVVEVAQSMKQPLMK